jgi:ABC-type nitrate/sulfonate/bicarbonate transport system permease component
MLAAWETLPRNRRHQSAAAAAARRRAENAGRYPRPAARCTRRSWSPAAEVIVAFIIAVPLGAAVGVAIAESDYIGQIFKPLLFYVFSVPKSIFCRCSS